MRYGPVLVSWKPWRPHHSHAFRHASSRRRPGKNRTWRLSNMERTKAGYVLGFRTRPRITATFLRAHEIASRRGVRGLPSLVKGAGLRILSRRGSQVQILPHASPRQRVERPPRRRTQVGIGGESTVPRRRPVVVSGGGLCTASI